ncbi:hypothetical protein LWI29_002446 [Acer saccharum]|uniref:Uncharacterized protein n=1 Tax=Acer saccharum TaxID=4024 RepID=A0AA39RQN1_ACESA|nr:hypothetical protein LWI29_002446 [Acer saccharum]
MTTPVHEMPRQNSVLDSRAQAISPSPSQLATAAPHTTADIATAGCRDFSIIPANSRATSGSNRAISAMPGNAPVATLVALDNAPVAHLAVPETKTVAHLETGLAAHPPAATATHPMKIPLTDFTCQKKFPAKSFRSLDVDNTI